MKSGSKDDDSASAVNKRKARVMEDLENKMKASGLSPTRETTINDLPEELLVSFPFFRSIF